MPSASARRLGFTLIELMVAVAVMALLVSLAGPSFRDMILTQRLRGVESQVVTDMQLARAEAALRGKYMIVKFSQDTAQTCYSVYYATTDDGLSNSGQCDCTHGVGTTCTNNSGAPIADLVEIKTVTVPRSSGVELHWPGDDSSALTFAFDFVTGGLLTDVTDLNLLPLALVTIHTRVDDTRQLTTLLSQAGRPRTCGARADNAQRMQVAAC